MLPQAEDGGLAEALWAEDIDSGVVLGNNEADDETEVEGVEDRQVCGANVSEQVVGVVLDWVDRVVRVVLDRVDHVVCVVLD